MRCCSVFCRQLEKELTNSDFSPATLRDAPGIRGARFFGAPQVSEGYIRLSVPEGPSASGRNLSTAGRSRGSSGPVETVLSVVYRNRAATFLLIVLCVLLVVLGVFFDSKMGQTLTTPLSLTLGHWRDVQIRANNLLVEIKRRKWQTLCTSEWPTLKVEWPAEGTFNINVILQVKERIFNQGPQGHPDQAPYIVVWESLVKEPPPWVSPFVPPCPPLNPTPHPVPSAPPAPAPHPTPTPTDPSKPPTSSNLYPVVPIDPPSSNNASSLRRPRQLQVLPPEESPLIDLLTEDPPPYHPPRLAPNPMGDPDHLGRNDPSPSPIAGRVRGQQRPEQEETSRLLPLRQGREPGSLQYWPFSASDLYNWKSHNPSFSQDPVALTALIESILVTHQPTWDDCQQLLQALLTTEERQKVFLEARKNVLGDDGRPTQLPNVIDATFPLTRPDWDFNTAAGRTHLRLYRQLLIAGLHNAGRRSTNLAQVRQVTQGKEESPTAFLERLKEAYRRYMPFDPDSNEQRGNVSMAFIWQLAPDIRNKLQCLENLQDFTLQDLLKEAEKIFNKRETQEEKEERLRKLQEEKEEKLKKEAEEKEEKRERKRNKELSKILAAVVQGSQGLEIGKSDREGDIRRLRIDRDQCAYCKERGHWAKNCPKRPKGNANKNHKGPP
ncbi:uncharacterized protein LOC132016258 [Mustela nigripes]|uniref:uncharacterized protein LOC132016258 n=1 Tax=Mustela nigripes TaxID=77151 RepID=UPI0028160D58|nr:uncharacterized protein LOC132016258 [Mustela nigripes]